MKRHYGTFDRNESFMYATCEEVLEVNFWSIVSDCRGLIRGTLAPRPWSDLAETWNKEPDQKTRIRHDIRLETADKIRRNQVKCLERQNRRNRIKQMARVLEANGLSATDALVKARELLSK